ncbi:EH signature domain-containing protein [Sphingomonas sp. MMS24-J13]|uniref:EH signature domain-containing protein n=1 Tax=Sphingomonas sp. MMS24-J13 TaxID=3238686 RepID=UPI00384A5DB8
MSALKLACGRASGAAALPRRGDRIEIERAEQRIGTQATGKKHVAEPWEGFLTRIRNKLPAGLKPKDLKRLLDGIWADDTLEDVARPLLHHSVDRQRKSVDRSIITTYLRNFPLDHPAFDDLTKASAMVAGRHEWPWQSRGTAWALWEPDEGPPRLSQALLATDDPFRLLRDVGLDGDLATGVFVEEALLSACEAAASQRDDIAQQSGRRLIALFERFPATPELNAALTYALLAPWTTSACTDAHQRLISGLLVQRNGDPRLAPQRWAALRRTLLDMFPDAKADEAFAVLRRWLVRATVREFFAIVAKTVERRDQWRERTEFWLAYLDAGFITDAWFAFGSQAERLARKFMDQQTGDPAILEGGGATSAQSALIFSIGDIRIAEWSDNGSCRFWSAADNTAPALYQRRYNGPSLRAMAAGEGFKAIPHNPPNGWQPKFARHVYRTAGVSHPKHGAGW